MISFGSLFSGLGGMDLGLERAGLECKWQVEIDPYCRSVLERHWPDVPKYEDVRDVSASSLEAVDLICGGFPCQPVSEAGKRQAQGDERWLWPEFARLVGELRPRYVLVENVPGLLQRGGAEVIADLASLGYDFEWDRLSASAVGAPHIRQRIFILAYPRGKQRREIPRGPCGHEGSDGQEEDHRPQRHGEGNGAGEVSRDVADTKRTGLQGLESPRLSQGVGVPTHQPARSRAESAPLAHTAIEGPQGNSPPRDQSPRPFDDRQGPTVSGAGLAGIAREVRDQWRPHWQWDPAEPAEPGLGYLVDGSPVWIPRVGRVRDRAKKIRGLGNAVVPQVAEAMGKYLLTKHTIPKEHKVKSLTTRIIPAVYAWKSNASLIADVANLHLKDVKVVFDATYGRGIWWRDWKPDTLITNDMLKPGADYDYDFREMDFKDREFECVAYDPPFRLTGTPDKGEFEDRYGLKVGMRWQDRWLVIMDGAEECGRIADKWLIVKCQDQVCSGQMRWQTHEITNRLSEEFRLVDRFDMLGSQRKQKTKQQHARGRPSTLLLFKRW